MRKITEDACKAFYDNENFKRSNTEVVCSVCSTKMYLFGNLIAERNENGLYISLCGHNTRTTRERLNGLRNVRVRSRNHVAYLNGFIWNGRRIKV